MTTANKIRKPNTGKTTNSSKASVKALDKCISYNEKLRLMVLEVLREESGRELANEARFNDTEFDWEAHNAQFRADYSETPLKELMLAAHTLYGLTNMNAIRERRAKHRGIRNERIARKSNGISPGLQYLDEDVDVDDEIDEFE